MVSAALSAAGDMRNFTVALPPPRAGRHVLVPAVCRCFVPGRWARLGALVVLDRKGSTVPHETIPKTGGIRRAISFAVRADGGEYSVMPVRHRSQSSSK